MRAVHDAVRTVSKLKLALKVVAQLRPAALGLFGDLLAPDASIPSPK